MTPVQERITEMGLDDTTAVAGDGWILELMEGGVVVKPHIGFRGSKTTLRPEDLGIRLPRDPERRQAILELLHFGERYLLPKATVRRLNSLAELGRRAVVNNSVETPFGRFLAARGFLKFRQEFDLYRGQFFAVRDEILRNYDAIQEVMADKYAKAAWDAWRRQNRLSADAELTPEQEIDLEAFVGRYVARVMEDFPARATIESSFYFEYEPTFVALPQMLAQAEAEADEIRRRSQLQARQEFEQAALEAAMRREVNRHWVAQKEALIDSFLVDVVASVRGRVYEAAANAAEAIRKNKSVPGRTVEGLVNLMSTLKTIDPYGDTELEEGLASLRPYLDVRPEDRQKEAILAQVEAVCTLAGATLANLGRGRVGGREVVAAPQEIDVVQARARLGLQNVEPPMAVTSAIARSGRRREL